MDDDLVRTYALEAKKAMEQEANRRIAEQTDPEEEERLKNCLLYTSPSPRDRPFSRMPSSA